MSVALPLDPQSLEDSLQYLIARALIGLVPNTSIVWGAQNTELQESPHVMLTLSNFSTNTTAHEVITATPGEPAGQEVTIDAVNSEEFDFYVDIFTGKVTANAGELFTPAWGLAKLVKNFLESAAEVSDEHIDELVIVSVGTITAIPTTVETLFEGRARVPVRCRVTDSFQFKTTTIETVEVTGTYTSS